MSGIQKCWCKSGLAYADCHMALDKKLEELKRKGEIVPTHRLIKNQKQIEGIRRACQVNTQILDVVEAKIHEGMTTDDIDRIVVEEMKKYGAKSADLGYEGYPKSVCTSVNDVVCHGIPSKRVVLKSGDIINVDCTTIVNGYFGDSSRMFLIGDVSERARELVKVTKECLDIAVQNIKPYCHLGDIGYYVSQHAYKNGCSVVRELGGHGVGLAMHEDPFVSHVGKLNTGMVLVPGMVFTIEPMINAGKAGVLLDADDGWTVYTADGSLSAQWEYTLLMTESGVEILAH